VYSSDLRYWLSSEGRGNLRGRAILGAVIGIVGMGAYLALQYVELRPVIWLELGLLESWIPANPSTLAVCVYLSFYVLVFSPGLVRSDLIFKRYVVAYLVTTSISLAVFALMPSGVSRESIVFEDASWIYQGLAEGDRPRNAFPSLHASLSVLAGIVIFPRVRGAILRTALVAWIAVIFWSTIATRQHVVIDLVSGGALAVAVWWWCGRRMREATSE
jgi:membrane-associated phospholipid phosphatase